MSLNTILLLTLNSAALPIYILQVNYFLSKASSTRTYGHNHFLAPLSTMLLSEGHIPASGCPTRGLWPPACSCGLQGGALWPGRGALLQWGPSGSLTASACSPPGICPLVSRGTVLRQWWGLAGGCRPQGIAAAACRAGMPHRGGLAGVGALLGVVEILQIILGAWRQGNLV